MMLSRQISVLPNIAKGLQQAQNVHNLPINMTISLPQNGRVEITLDYDEEDDLLVDWFAEVVVDKIADGRLKF